MRGLVILLLYLLPLQSAFNLEGTKTSYAQFRKWTGGSHSRLRIQFRTGQSSALLLYTQDKENCFYLELKLVSGEVQLRFDFGGGEEILRSRGEERLRSGGEERLRSGGEERLRSGGEERLRSGGEERLRSGGEERLRSKVNRVSSKDWRKVVVTRDGRRTILEVDSQRWTTICNSTNYQPTKGFSDHSYLYLGGLPTWISLNLKDLLVPTAAFEPRLLGEIQDLEYAEAGDSSYGKQEIISYKGIRSSTVNSCTFDSPCRNGGECIPTDQGYVCDCKSSRYTGLYCEQSQQEAEVYFTGRNGIFFDTSSRTVLTPVLAAEDQIQFSFKTVLTSGLLYFNGHFPDFVLLYLEDGKIRLSVQLNSGQLDTTIKSVEEFFNDNQWHLVVLSRRLYLNEGGDYECQVVLEVDRKYTEKWKTMENNKFLRTNKIILGGNSLNQQIALLEEVNNFVGCFKQVVYTAETVKLDVLDQFQSEHSLFSSFGSFELKCQEARTSLPMPYVSKEGEYKGEESQRRNRVISMTDRESYLNIPSWRLGMSASIAFAVKTTEKNGLLLFATGKDLAKNEYMAMEIVNGGIFVHFNFGFSAVKIKGPKEPLYISNGEWHEVELSLQNRQGRVTVDGETEVFTTPDLSRVNFDGSFYLGGVDEFETRSSNSSSVYTLSLKEGFVGCIRDFYINGNAVDIVHLSREQNSGSIRLSCHTMPVQCFDRPCNNGGNCKESWNRYECDCTSTSFSGPTCSRGTSTAQFTGDNFLEIKLAEESFLDILLLNLRFRSSELSGFLFSGTGCSRADILEISLEQGKIKVVLQIGIYDKVLYIGQALNDDLWHTIRLKKLGTSIEGSVDDEDSSKAEMPVSDTSACFSKYQIGGQRPNTKTTSAAPNFVGRIQQLILNKENLLEQAHLQQIQYQGNVKFHQVDDVVYNSISFLSHHTYIVMSQMKVYNKIDIFFKFKTSNANGLILYNDGKNGEYLAVELVNGHIHYSFNMGYGPVTLRDNADISLADNKFHSVWIRRPSRFSQVLVIDGYHKVSSTGIGDNYYLNLDGFLYLGGVKSEMYKKFANTIVSRIGFQGCLANIEINSEALNPNKDLLVPSTQVSKGCQESFAFEFSSDPPGMITYRYPHDKQPDTKSDRLTVGFMTAVETCALVRVDSSQSNDFLELRLEQGYILAEYNLGTETISFKDASTLLNNGEYHIVKFERHGPNATLQVDNTEEKYRVPDGRHLTVFNSQYLVQIGGTLHQPERKNSLYFQGIYAGLVYNGLNLLERAFQSKEGINITGSVRRLERIPLDYKKSLEQSMVPVSGRIRTVPAAQKTGKKESWTNCDDDDLCEGSGEKASDTGNANFGRGVYFLGGGYMPCDDDEDICDFGSGDKENSMLSPGEHEKVFETSSSTSSPFSTASTSTSSPASTSRIHSSNQGEESSSPPIWSVFPIPEEDTTHNSEKCYDDKHNVICDEVTKRPTEAPKKDMRSMSGTMSLVIGIILGSFIAMILIVIIVLKVRTGVDVTESKQDDRGKYQFSSPSEKEDYSVDTGTTSLIKNKNNNNNNNNNGGLFNGSISQALTTDRARLFKKANSYGRPVREWYV